MLASNFSRWVFRNKFESQRQTWFTSSLGNYSYAVFLIEMLRQSFSLVVLSVSTADVQMSLMMEILIWIATRSMQGNNPLTKFVSSWSNIKLCSVYLPYDIIYRYIHSDNVLYKKCPNMRKLWKWSSWTDVHTAVSFYCCRIFICVQKAQHIPNWETLSE